MAEPAYSTGGKRVLQELGTGQLVEVDPAVADQYISDGTEGGRRFAPVDQATFNEQVAKAKAETIGGQAETFARNTAEGLYTVAKGAANLSDAAGGANPYGLAPTAPVMTPADQLAYNASRSEGLFAGLDSAQAGISARQGGATEQQALTAEQQAATGAEQYSQTLNEANPTTAMAGQIVGESLPFLAMPGANAIGAGMAKGIGGAVASGVGGKIGQAAASRLSQYAIQGALEGGIQNAVVESSDPEAEGEDLLSSFAMGAALGGGMSAGITGAGMAAGRLASVFGDAGNALAGKMGKGVSELAEEGAAIADNAPSVGVQTADEILDGPLAEEFGKQGKVAAAMEDLAGEPRGATTRNYAEYSAPASKKGSSLEAYDAATGLTDAIDRVSLDLQPKLTEGKQKLRNVMDHVNKSQSKFEDIRNMMGDIADDAERKAASADELLAVGAEVENLFKDLNAGKRLSGAAKSQAQATQRSITESVMRIAEADDLAQAMEISNRAKQILQKEKLSLQEWGNISARKGNIDIVENELIQNSVQRLNDVQERLRLSLEDANRYGDAAAASQKNVNKIYSDGAIDASRSFDRTFFRDTGARDWDTGYRKYEMDAGRLASFFKQMGTAEGDVADRAMAGWMGKMGDLTDAIDAHYSLPPNLKADLASAREIFAEVDRSVGMIKDQKALANKWARQLAEESTMSPIAGGSLAIAGGAIGGLPGAAAGMVLGSVLKPASMVKMQAAVRNVATKFRMGAVKNLGNWIASGAGKAPPSIKLLKQAYTGSRRPIVSASVAAFLGGHTDDKQALAARMREMDQLDPMQVANDFYMQGTGIHASLAAGEVAGRAKAYLASLAPAWRQSNELLGAEKIPPSFLERNAYAQSWGAIAHPETVVADIMSGVATPSQVGALKAVYPRTYERIRAEVITGIQSAARQGNRIPMHKADTLSIVLDAPELGTFKQSTSDSIASALYARDQQQPPTQQQSQQGALSQSSPSQEFLST